MVQVAPSEALNPFPLTRPEGLLEFEAIPFVEKESEPAVLFRDLIKHGGLTFADVEEGAFLLDLGG
jgi:hypothetical protein